MGGVIFKIFITRWHYSELGNNKNSILFLGFILAGQYSFFRKKTHSDNFMSFKTSQIIGTFYMQIGAYKSA